MQRTDTEMLDYLLPLCAGRDSDDPTVFASRVEALTAALKCGYAGREAVALAMGAQTFEPGQPLPPVGALDLVADEIKRIREVVNYSAEQDDTYVDGEMATASACYLAHGDARIAVVAHWPWPIATWKPTPNDRLRELVKGTALAACEIDRLLRNPPAEVESPQEELLLGVEEERPDDAEPGVCVDAQGLDPIRSGNPCYACDAPDDLLPPTGTVTALGAACYACGVIDTHEDDCPLGIAQAVASIGGVTGEARIPAGAVITCDEVRAGHAAAIRKGSRVRVVRSAPDWEGWVPAMGKLVGNTYIVEDRVEAIRSHPATVQVGDWHVPASCCEVVP